MTDPDSIQSTADEALPSVRPGRQLLRPVIEADVNVHVFSVSAGLVGVCLTVIGIIRIGINVRSGYNTVADELLAADSICFMAACLLAYSSLRTSGAERGKRFEAYADRLFVIGMATMCIACSLVAFSLL